MTRRAEEEIDTSGHDSFLDVVANLVGILLILIMVLGVRTRSAWQALDTPSGLLSTSAAGGTDANPGNGAGNPTSAAERELREFIRSARAQLAKLKQSTLDLDAEASGLNAKAEERKQERNALQLAVSAAEAALTKVRGELDQNTQAALASAKSYEAAKSELLRLQQDRDAQRNLIGPAKVIDHYPTPLAQTVFGREEHFRLLQGRLTHVPLNELVQEFKQDAQNKLWKLQHVNEVTEALPPQGGFRLRYTLQRKERREEFEGSMVLRKTIELDRFVLIPEADDLGVPVDEALAENSEFRRRLTALRPQETTVTIWTYPDSYTDFRRVKEFLRTQGFLAAGRPMPDGYPIGGAPNGNNSAAE